MHKRYQDMNNLLDRLHKMDERHIAKHVARVYRKKPRLWPKVYQVYKLMERQSSRCYWCCTDISIQRYEVEHIYPRCRGGSDHIRNLRLSCLLCNDKKSINLPMDFALYLLGAPYVRTKRFN